MIKLIAMIQQIFACIPGLPVFMIKWGSKAERLVCVCVCVCVFVCNSGENRSISHINTEHTEYGIEADQG